MELAISIFTAISNLVLGLFTYLKNPKSATHQLLAFLAAQISIWSILNYISLHAPTEASTLFWIRVDMLPGAPMGPTLYLLANTFPGRKINISRSKLTAIIFFVLLTMLLAISPYMFTAAIFESSNIRAVPGPAIAVFMLNFIGFSLLTFIKLVSRLKKSFGLELAQIRYLLFGIISTFTLITTTDLLGVVLLKSSFFVPLGPLYSLLLIGSISYSIVKHRFLDIRLVVARTVAYTLLVLIVGFVYGLGVFAIGKFITGQQAAINDVVISTALALVMAISFQRLRLFLERLTDKIFYKESYDTNNVLGELSKVMAATLHLDNLTHSILEILVSQLRLSKAAFILFDDHHISSVKSEGFASTPDLDESEVDFLSQTRDALVFEDLDESPQKAILRRLNLSAAIHLRSEGVQIGLLVLGEKQSGDPYSHQDLQLLEIFAPEAAVAIQNSESYEEIRRFNITLQEEVERATSDLQSANEKLKILDKAKDEFLSLASHELRTPMTAIKSYVWMVLNCKTGVQNPTSQKYLQLVFDSTQRLINLVNDMLDISRIESGKVQLRLEPFAVSDLMYQVMEEFKARAADKKITLALDPIQPLPSLTADRDKVLQVLENLVGNALKFTPSEGKITLTVARKENFIEFSVNDTGKGIAEADFPKLFTKFERGAPLTTLSEPGTGLGLYLCKQYVQLHKGTINVKSKVDQGSTFSFTLPLG